LLLRHEDVGAAEISRMLGCARATVYRTVYRYEDLGVESVRDQRCQREPSKVTPQVEQQLLEYLDYVPQDYRWERSNWTLELLALQLARDTGVEVSDSHVLRVLRRCGCRRGRPRPGLRIPVRGRPRVRADLAMISPACDTGPTSPNGRFFYYPPHCAPAGSRQAWARPRP
jgi:transposase